MYKEKIVDAVTGEETFRDYTAAEIKAVEAAQKQDEKELAQLQARAAAKQALLDKLGITADEAKLLLG